MHAYGVCTLPPAPRPRWTAQLCRQIQLQTLLRYGMLNSANSNLRRLKYVVSNGRWCNCFCNPIITLRPSNDNPNYIIQVGNVFGFIISIENVL